MVEKRLFLQIQNQYYVSQSGEHDVMPIAKRIEITTSTQVCLISGMNFDYKEKGGKKAFPINPKSKYRLSHCGEHDCCANNEKNDDYYVHPCLSLFTDEF